VSHIARSQKPPDAHMQRMQYLFGCAHPGSGREELVTAIVRGMDIGTGLGADPRIVTEFDEDSRRGGYSHIGLDVE
ncbi:MAG: hypothetical protein MHM6MM_006336, partial [Cercozoa sp. M6MM]